MTDARPDHPRGGDEAVRLPRRVKNVKQYDGGAPIVDLKGRKPHVAYG